MEKHLRNVNALPAALPNIDFAAYNKVSVPGMVESFETKYKALQVPYPSDQGSLQGESYLGCFYFLYFTTKNISAIEDQAKEQEAAYKQFCADSSKNIADIKVELAKWEAMKPVEEMNLEEALDAGLIGTTIKGIPHPDVPSFWPHEEVGWLRIYFY